MTSTSEDPPGGRPGHLRMLMQPGDGWPVAVVMTNWDHSINQAVADRVRAGDVFAQHSAWNFVGWVWYQDGRWHEHVQVRRADRGFYSADTLEDLMKTVNDKFGWE